MIIKKNHFFSNFNNVSLKSYLTVSILIVVTLSVVVIISSENDISRYLRGFNGVIFSHNSGNYSESFELKLRTLNPLTKIYYTLDGTEPTLNSTLYSEPIQITNNTTVRAKSFINENTYSLTFTNSFFFNENISIPIVTISVDPKDLYDTETGILGLNYSNRGQEWQKPINFEIIEEGVRNNLKQDLTIRVSGGSSRKLAQKSFRLCADSKVGINYINYNLFSKDLPRTKCFLLRNFGNDWGHSLIRDVLLQKNSESTGINFQRHKFVNVFINGEYYSLASMQEYHDAFYFSEKYGGDPQNYEILENTIDKSGRPSVIYGNEAVRDEIVNLIKVMDNDEISTKEKYDIFLQSFDVDNYIDYQLLNTYYGNIDWITSNTRYFRYNPEFASKTNDLQMERDGKWRFFLQDLDSSFGLANEERGYSDRDDNMIKRASDQIFQNNTKINVMFRELLKNDTFKIKFFNRYKELRSSIFMPEHIIKNIDEYEKTLEPHIEKYNSKWKGSILYNDKVFDQDKEKWMNKMQELRDYANQRPEKYDKDIKEVLGIDYEL